MKIRIALLALLLSAVLANNPNCKKQRLSLEGEPERLSAPICTGGQYSHLTMFNRAHLTLDASSYPIQMTPETFLQMVPEEDWLIAFYADWCHYCEMFIPDFKKFAPNMASTVKTAIVSCSQFPDFCYNLAISAYPTILLFHQNKMKKFYGMRDEQTLTDFYKQHVNVEDQYTIIFEWDNENKKYKQRTISWNLMSYVNSGLNALLLTLIAGCALFVAVKVLQMRAKSNGKEKLHLLGSRHVAEMEIRSN